MSHRGGGARLVVIRAWRDPGAGIRLRIVDRADLPPSERTTVVTSDVESAMRELRRILASFATQTNSEGERRV